MVPKHVLDGLGAICIVAESLGSSMIRDQCNEKFVILQHISNLSALSQHKRHSSLFVKDVLMGNSHYLP